MKKKTCKLLLQIKLRLPTSEGFSTMQRVHKKKPHDRRTKDGDARGASRIFEQIVRTDHLACRSVAWTPAIARFTIRNFLCSVSPHRQQLGGGCRGRHRACKSLTALWSAFVSRLARCHSVACCRAYRGEGKTSYNLPKVSWI